MSQFVAAEVIERVAEALYAEEWGPNPVPWQNVDTNVKSRHRRQALIAVSAILEAQEGGPQHKA